MIARLARPARRQDLSFDDVRAAERLLAPGALVGLLARMRAGSLDRALIARADPAGSRLLAARARQLTSPRSRASLARGLEALLWSAQQGSGRWRVAPRREAVCANASSLAELGALLTSTAPLYARGLAALECLLVDATGPVYRGNAEAIARGLERCRLAMTGTD